MRGEKKVYSVQSVPSESGPDLDGIEQGMSNVEVEIGVSAWFNFNVRATKVFWL